MRVCVTGGTGFVGSHIVRALLEAGHQVRVLHRTSSKLDALTGLETESVIGDLSNVRTLREAFSGCGWVFHVAAVADYWRADHDWMFEVNVEGTRRVLQAAREAGVQRVIFTSSAAAIGLTDDGTPADETLPFNLKQEQFPYGYSKHLAEQVVAEAVAGGQDVVTLNPSVIIGPGDLNMISGTFIAQVAQWQWLAPVTSGSLGVTDVRDVALTHLAAAERGVRGERYLINTANYTQAAWFGMIAATVGAAPPLLTMPNGLLPVVAAGVRTLRRFGVETPLDAEQVALGARQITFDASKAHHNLHQPQIAMEQSLADTYQWYQERGIIRATALSRMLKAIGRLWRS